jgi:hypothetical protein
MDADEEQLAQQLRTELINNNLYCPRSQLSSAAKRFWLEKYADGERDLGDDVHYKDVPAFGSRWQRRFMESNGFSARKCHVERRPPKDANDANVAEFLNKMQNIMVCYADNLSNVINMDETSWKVIPNNWRTVANKGQEGVKCVFGVDQKICVTAVAGISAAGDKLPLWIVVKGITERCEISFRLDQTLQNAIEAGKLLIVHSKNGWMDADISKQYLDWLRRIFPTGDLSVVWDGCRAHENSDVKIFARDECQIDLTFVPHGQTGRWQPLDRRIFGDLKSRARARFNAAHVCLDRSRPILNKIWSIRVLLECWDSIEEENVRKSWNALIG